MSSTPVESFTAKYRLARRLSLLQLASSAATLALYGANGNYASKVLQLAPTIYALLTIGTLHRMLYYTRHVNKAKAYSRIDMQYCMLIYMIGMWALCVVCWIYGATQSAVLSNALASCAPHDSYFLRNSSCVPLWIDLFLPFLIIAALHSAMRALRQRAVSVHGTARIQGPVQNTPDTPNETPGVGLPAWLAPDLHVADLGENSESEGSTPKFVPRVENV
ncbi:hypothetical protein B0H19DRAFT_1154268 [Mycena capillaripes]|nr:hypothetical protein B0H19DRAFT_1154268 [Mycena capillaripes]